MPLILHSQASSAARLFVFLSCLFLFCGCKDAFKAEDPQLKPIHTMLQQKLPAGINQAIVLEFLSARGYETEPPEKPGTIVAVIRHVDPQFLRPVTARVTFYFDANGKLDTFDLVRIANQPIPQEQEQGQQQQQ
jgi:hypothetical protein